MVYQRRVFFFVTAFTAVFIPTILFVHLDGQNTIYSSVMGATTQAGSSGVPSISSVSGTWIHKNTVTITGSGFGAKSQAAPVRWDDFESGTVGQNLTGWEIYATSDQFLPKYAAVGRTSTPGSKSSWQHFQSEGPESWNSDVALKGYRSNKFYVSGWISGNHTGPLSRNVKTLAFRGTGTDSWGLPNARLDQYPDSGDGHHYTSNCVDYVVPDPSSTNKWDINGTLVIDDGNWHRVEAWVDMGTPNGNNGLFTLWKDTAQWGASLTGTMLDSQCWLENIHFFSYYATDDLSGKAKPGLAANAYWDEIYIDTTLARVELGNASTWAASTHREIQIPSAWSDTSVTTTVNRGSFAPGSSVYLYVVNENGVMNSTGYPVTIGNGGGGDTPPTSPAGLGANATSSSSITINWTASTDDNGVANYQVQRCTGLSAACPDASFSQVGTPTASPFIDNTGLSADTDYSYRVRAVDTVGQFSPWTNTVSAKTQVGAPTVSPTSTPTPACHNLYPSGSASPTSYGASWNPLSAQNELLVQATSCAGDSANVTLGSGTSGLYTYSKGYYWTGSAWQQFTITPTGGSTQMGEWILGAGTGSIRLLQQPTYFVGYTCQSVEGSWKCGCKDVSCITPFWQLQAVQ